MALKSYSLKKTLKKKKSKSNIIKTGVGAVIGVAFISTLSGLIKK